jgi:excisionase family DNA binding protein
MSARTLKRPSTGGSRSRAGTHEYDARSERGGVVSVQPSLQVAVPDDLLEALAVRVAELLAPVLAMPAVSPWLDVAEAADYLRCKPKRIYDLISQRRIPVHRDGGRVLLRRDELDRYLAADAADTPLTPPQKDGGLRGVRGEPRTVSPRIKGAA